MAMTVSVFPNAILFTKQPIPIIVSTSGDPLATTIEMLVTIYPDPDEPGNFIEVRQYEVPASDGKVRFDLQGLLDEYMNNEWAEPTGDEGGMTEVGRCPIGVWVELFEIQSSAVQSTLVLNDEDNDEQLYYALQGGVDYWWGSKRLLDYFQGYNTGNLFHSWRGSSRIFDKRSRNFLYYFNRSFSGTDIEVRIRVYDEGGLIHSDDTIVSGINVFTMYQCCPTYTQLQTLFPGLDDNFTHFTFQLYDVPPGSSAITELITFYLDKKVYKNRLYVVYQNSLNAFEDVRFIGDQELAADYERTVSIKAQDKNEDFVLYASTLIDEVTPEGGRRRTGDVRESLQTKVNTGYISKNQIHLLRELLLSPRIYILEEHNNWLRPVELTDKTKSLIKTQDYERGLPLELRDQFTNRVWTPVWLGA